MVYCVICEKSSENWVTNPHTIRQSEFTKMIGTTDLDHHLCAFCSCGDRERHLWLYMAASGFLPQMTQQKVLHLSPELHIERRLRAFNPIEYVCGDLYSQNPSHLKVDCESLPFVDGYFDLVLCNHVLQKVGNPRASLLELARCLTPDGFLIAQTPYVAALQTTFELAKVPSKALCQFLYGQEDNARLFGRDVVDYFHGAHLNGRLFDHSLVLPAIDSVKYGCNESEPFFLFAKNTCQQFPF